MERKIRVVLIAVLLLPAALVAGDVISTHCEERTVDIDSEHAVTRLGPCGNERSADLLWHLDRIDQIAGSLDGRFERPNRGEGSVVYVMDTGVMASHDEFAADEGSHVIAGFDVAGSVPIGASACRSGNKAMAPCFADFEELPAASHGTAVASIVAGRNIGVAPEAKIVSIRVMNERGLATTRAYLEGLDAIVRHAWNASTPRFQTAVVNISGWVLERITADPSPVPYSTVEKKMLDMIAGVDARGRRNANGKRFLFVVAGNNLDGGCGESGVVDRFPAILGPEIAGIITVGGMTQQNGTWSGTCRGGLEILAPAQSIFSATITSHDHYRGRKPGQRSGTSFAAPIISGIAAQMLSDHPSTSPEQLEEWITATPSRTVTADALYADGKVAYVRAGNPAVRPVAAKSAMMAP